MREDELRMELFDLRENECVEFKEWVGQFSIWGKEDETDRRNCVYAYLYLEKVTNEKGTILSARDLIVLQRIKDLDEHIPRSDVSRFLKMGIIEKIGKTKGVKYILSHRFYQLSGRTGIHTRLSGLSRDEKKALIKKHLERNPSGGTLQDFSDGLPELKKQDISNLLQELKQEGLIKVDGKTIRAVWKIKSI